jgi:hypothetical protein
MLRHHAAMSDNKAEIAAVNVLDGKPTTVPGQAVLDGMQSVIGYDTAVLDPWQETFCWAYVVNGGHGQSAYLKAKPKVKETTARVESSKLLTSPAILARIESIKLENRKRWAVTADDVIEYHGRVMNTDRRGFFKANGARIPTHELSDDLAAITDLESTFNKECGVMFLPVVASRQKSADSLARILGLDKSRFEMTGKDGAPMEHIMAVADEVSRLDELRSRFGTV